MLALSYGPPTEQDIKKIRDAWYGLFHITNPVTKDGSYTILRSETGTSYGAVVFRHCDKTYWHIRDIWQMYRKWLGPVIPYEVVPVKREVIDYVRRSTD